MWKADWKWHLVMVVQLLLFLHGVEMQQQQQPTQKFQQQQREIGSEQKPQIYWATSINSNSNNNNRRYQQANDWDAVAQKNYLDRQWGASVPAPAPAPAPAPNPPPTTPAPYSPPAPAATAPPPAPVYAPPPAPVYAPPPAPVYAPPPAPVYAPAPTSPPYQPYPPAYPEPAPPAYPEPAPPAYPEPAPPAYPEPAPAYNPAPPPAYDPPSYGPAQSPAGQYYYYIPVKETKEKGPSIKDMFEKDKEALSALLPDHHKDNLTNEQKIWLSVLTPLIVVALVVPLAAILFSSFTVTTNGRKFGELNMSDMKKSLRDIVESYGSVLETDECMQRIICDLGSYAKDVPGNSLVLTFLSTLVPDTMKNNMAIFTKAATYGAEKAQCDSFKCSAWKY